jgi:hypothetical protein
MSPTRSLRLPLRTQPPPTPRKSFWPALRRCRPQSSLRCCRDPFSPSLLSCAASPRSPILRAAGFHWSAQPSSHPARRPWSRPWSWSCSGLSRCLARRKPTDGAPSSCRWVDISVGLIPSPHSHISGLYIDVVTAAQPGLRVDAGIGWGIHGMVPMASGGSTLSVVQRRLTWPHGGQGCCSALWRRRERTTEVEVRCG